MAAFDLRRNVVMTAEGVDRSMKHQQQPFIIGEVRGAFALDQPAIDRLAVLCANYIQDVEWKFTLDVKSGEGYATEDIADLAKLPLHHAHERAVFQVEASSSTQINQYFHLVYYYNPPKVSYIASATRDDKAASAAMRSWLLGCRPWYHWMFRVRHPPPLPTTVVLLGALVIGLYADTPKRLTMLLVGGVALVVGLALQLRDGLFDPIVLAFGDETARQQRKVAARRWLFGTILTATALAVISQLVQRGLPTGG